MIRRFTLSFVTVVLCSSAAGSRLPVEAASMPGAQEALVSQAQPPSCAHLVTSDRTVRLIVSGLTPAAALGQPVSIETAALARDATNLGDAVNAQRAANGLSPLQADTHLAELADVRSRDQVARHYLSHVAPDGNTVFTLLDTAGVRWSVAGENLAQTNASNPAQSAIDGFMHSPEPRANVLGTDYGHIGVGAAAGDDGTIILTVIFTN